MVQNQGGKVITETGFKGVGKREAWRLIGVYREISVIPGWAVGETGTLRNMKLRFSFHLSVS